MNAETVTTPTKAERDAAYDKIDRYLRNNLDDADYANYSAALECVYAGPSEFEQWVERVQACEPCNGKGLDPACREETCIACGGSGEREVFVQSGGQMPWDAGSGHNEAIDCPKCNGTGAVQT